MNTHFNQLLIVSFRSTRREDIYLFIKFSDQIRSDQMLCFSYMTTMGTNNNTRLTKRSQSSHYAQLLRSSRSVFLLSLLSLRCFDQIRSDDALFFTARLTIRKLPRFITTTTSFTHIYQASLTARTTSTALAQ